MTGVARVATLSVITAWVLAGFVASEAMVQFLGYPAMSLLPPAKWPAFLFLGGLAGLAGCEGRSLATGSILALGLLVAILRWSAPETSSVVTGAFVLGLAAMAGLGAGRTAALLIERRYPASDAT